MNKSKEFLDFLFSLIGSCQLQDLDEDELQDFLDQLYANYKIIKK